MNTEYFTEMHKLIERAKQYEKLGREQEALEIYLEIHEKFFPNTSDLYERPAILLEKRKRFEEAIHICEKAIKFINEGKITGIKDNFTRRIERIKARPDYLGESTERQKESKRPSKPAKEKKEHVEKNASVKEAREPKKFSFFKEKTEKEPKEETAEATRHFKTPKWIERLTQFDIKEFFNKIKTAFINMKKPSKKTVAFTLVLLAGLYAIYYGLERTDRSKFEVFIDVSEFESTGEPVGNPFPVDLENLPPITGAMIDTAVKSVSQMNGVETAGIIVQKNVTGFIIMLKPGTSRADAKNAAENFVKALSAAAASENSELTGPNMVSYGSLYDYYGALVVAGENPESIILKGTKVPKGIGFIWK